MMRYLLEILVIQLVFLLTYDFLLKRETFFQWNRWYLMAAFLLSLILPQIKIEALKTEISPENLLYHTPFVAQLETIALSATEAPSFWEVFSIYHWMYLLGATVMAFWFFAKLYRILRLKQEGMVTYYPHFTKVIVQNSAMVFSFFKMVFLGDAIAKDKQPQILAHELVHIKQWHSLDLLFFELMRILFWFNPLTYVYQNRMAELHEFIADAQVAKKHRKKQYQLLLSETFQTYDTSFINPFYKKSQLNKRIAMLTKQRSKKVYQLKYGLLLPLALGMLVYSSCEQEPSTEVKNAATIPLDETVIVGYDNALELSVKDLGKPTQEEKNKQEVLLAKIARDKSSVGIRIKDNAGNMMVIETKKGVVASVSVDKSNVKLEGIDQKKGETQQKHANELLSFAKIENVPIFPGCEDSDDKKACFMEKMNKHIRKNFNYPKKAQEMGIQGRVVVLFTIDKEGNISNIKKRGPHQVLENEVERIINRLPRMQPGEHNGKVVAVPFSIPVTFKLQGSEPQTSTKPKISGGMQVNAMLSNKDGKSYFAGQVVDEASLGLPGVTVSIVGKGSGVFSDFDGNFVIPANKEDIVEFEYIGLPTIHVEAK